MLVAIVCAAAVVLSLGWLAVLAGGLVRRLKDLDTQLERARERLAGLNDVLAQLPRT